MLQITDTAVAKVKTLLASESKDGYGLRVAQMVVTPNLLIYTGNVSDGTPTIFAIDKATGKTLAQVEAPAESNYGIMTYVHKGRQYLMLQTRSTLTAMALADY